MAVFLRSFRASVIMSGFFEAENEAYLTYDINRYWESEGNDRSRRISYHPSRVCFECLWEIKNPGNPKPDHEVARITVSHNRPWHFHHTGRKPIYHIATNQRYTLVILGQNAKLCHQFHRCLFRELVWLAVKYLHENQPGLYIPSFRMDLNGPISFEIQILLRASHKGLFECRRSHGQVFARNLDVYIGVCPLFRGGLGCISWDLRRCGGGFRHGGERCVWVFHEEDNISRRIDCVCFHRCGDEGDDVSSDRRSEGEWVS